MDLVLLTCIKRPDRAFSDLDRACILARSLERYLDPAGAWRVHVIAADREIGEVRDRLSRYRLDLAFHPHSDLLPDFSIGQGWRMQQFVKLLAHKYVSSRFFLSVDSDHILTRPLREADLVRGERAMFTPERREQNERWWLGAAKILGTRPVRDPVTAMTCVCMETSVTRGLLTTLSARLGAGWMDALLGRDDWSEYCLYSTFARRASGASRYHFPGPLLGSGHSLWYPHMVGQWEVDAAFHQDHFFIALQSSLDIPPEFIREMTAPYLGPWPD